MFWFHRNQINLFSNLFRYWSFCAPPTPQASSISVTVLVHPAQAEKGKQTSPKLLSVRVASLQYANTCHHSFNVLYFYPEKSSFGVAWDPLVRWSSTFFNHKNHSRAKVFSFLVQHAPMNHQISILEYFGAWKRLRYRFPLFGTLLGLGLEPKSRSRWFGRLFKYILNEIKSCQAMKRGW